MKQKLTLPAQPMTCELVRQPHTSQAVTLSSLLLVWDQKGQTHSTLNTHMENVDLLISEEAHLHGCSPHTVTSPVLIWSFQKDSLQVLAMRPPARTAAGLSTSAERGRKIRRSRSTLLEPHAANECKGSPRGLRAVGARCSAAEWVTPGKWAQLQYGKIS